MQCQDYVLKCNLTEAACCTDQAQRLSWTEVCLCMCVWVGWEEDVCINSKFVKNQIFVSYASVKCCHSEESKWVFFFNLNKM